MEKKSITNHKVFLRKSAGYRNMVDKLLVIERKFLKELDAKDVRGPLDCLEGLRITLSIASYYIAQNEIYRSVFTNSNESILKSARKYLALSIDYLIKIYSTDPSFVYDERDIRHQAHAEIDEFMGYKMVTRTGFYLEYLNTFFEPQSRWQWNILDLSYELALVFKNSFNFKTLIQRLDLRENNVYERKLYLNNLKMHLNEVADGFRVKYEITRMSIDMDKAIRTLEILRHLHLALAEQKDIEAQNRKIELWQAKVIADQKMS
ncbi:hypothetical protein PVA44_03000 [Entomospira nematocerorum]|uniref:Uncharacterized protein n=1 Tax=Entomospira nematocerorum TaxID=2719987 RepID=A0A968KV83_9SPIO|nr:hypothetical protein [Entomospira nematocera]NIZ46998.1 hypothetical protein [Entomospira nematocera]WDI34458.1 hypothetical protein PVA44_03000 [Entomospira nematocera]